MIYAEDGDTLSWDSGSHHFPDPQYTFYEFLGTMPLFAKKEMVQSMSQVMGSHSLPNVFVTSSQMRWAVGVIRLGLQLPVEDLNLIEHAFEQYSELIFVLHRLKFAEGGMEPVDFAALEVLTRPSVLFNPRLFFESDLPERQAAGSVGVQGIYKERESYVAKSRDHDGVVARPDTSASYPNSPKFECVPEGGESGPSRIYRASSTVASGKQQAETDHTTNKQGSAGRGVWPPHNEAQMRQAIVLWDKYVDFLARVLRVYSTMVRGLQPVVDRKIMLEIFTSITSVLDMILSQGGANPRLRIWRQRYRGIMGAELWDATWATIGDRLEMPAIKLLLDVWGWLIGQHRIAEDRLITNVRYWVHRDRVVEAWMLVVSQISKRVLRAHYPHDLTFGTDKLRVHFANFSMSTTTSDRDAKYILLAFTRTHVDFDAISGHGYYVYATEVCNIIERILAINKLVVVNGMQYAQSPPTANYILFYYGHILFAMAMRDYVPSRKYIVAKQHVMAVLTRVLTLEEPPEDKMLPESRTLILHAIDMAITKNYEAQAILPTVPALLKNCAYVRPFIPKFFDLVCHVLPKERHMTLILDECLIRHYAYEAMSALIAYVGYYHHLGQSDMIADTSGQLRKHLDFQLANVVQCAKPESTRQTLEKLIRRIKRCAFKKSAREDPVFVEYLRLIFQTLLLSVATENSVDNIQYVTCVILNFLYQYSRYSPGYMEAFVHFYIDQLANTKSDQMAIVYAYGLMQTAMVTWTEALPGEQVKRITSAVVDALADCDKSLSRYTCWNPYHQLFISSLRCLTSWISILPDSTHLTPETLSKLVSLLARCNTFINCAGPKSQNTHTKHGLRLQLVTSNVEESTVDYSLDPLDDTDEDEDASPGTESSGGSIKAFTMLGIFGKSAKIALPAFVCNGECKKIHMLSRSLYRTLYTAIAVFSSTILRGMDTMQAYARYAPTDVFTARRAISQKRLPDTSFILKGFSKQIVRKLDGYVPTSIRIFSVFHRAVYTAINFQRYENGKWSDSVIFTTSRYAGGSKQWLAFPSMPNTEECPSAQPTDPQCKHDDEYDSLPWIRLGNEVMYPKSVKKKLRFSDAHGAIRGIKLQVDDASEREIEAITASDFKRLHGHREIPDMRFAPAQLPEQQPRGNTYDRPTCTSFFGIDFALVEIVEPVLRELDQLDDLDRPFSAHTGIIYLQSPESLSTKRDICKGPLRGTSRELSHFLSMLNRQQLSPAELVKRHSDVPLLRYVFGIKGFKVCYNLAPNLSAMISGKQMCADDNREFYELLHERGIAVLWFDSHPGTLDTDLAWQFIDRLQSYDVMPQRRFRDDEYLQTSAQPRTSLGIPAASVPVRGGSEIRSRSVGKRSARSQSPPRKKTRPSNRAIYRGRSRRTPGLNSQSIWNSSKPGDLSNATRRAQAGKNKDPRAYIKSAATEVSISASVNPPEVAPQGTRTPQNVGTPQSTTTTRQGAKSNRERGTDKQAIVAPSKVSTESLMTFLASNPQDPYNYRGQSTGDANRPTETAYAKKLEPKVRILIGLAPVVNTRGRLIKIAVSAKGGPEKLNRDFELMTGPLMSNMVVEAKDIAYILSATILDASANIASLSGSDFSMVYKRMEMIHRIIEKHSIKHESISDAHKFMFPVGTSGVQSTLHINGSGVDPSTD